MEVRWINRGDCDGCDVTGRVREFRCGMRHLWLCTKCLVGYAEADSATVQDVDEAHHVLTMAGIGGGEISERVGDLVDERDELAAQVEKLTSAAADSRSDGGA